MGAIVPYRPRLSTRKRFCPKGHDKLVTGRQPLSRACRECNKDKDRLRRTGATRQQFDALVVAQGGRCAACLAPPDGELLCVDHDHVSGTIRGLLCRWCNLALGNVHDSTAVLKRLIQYLEGPK